MEFESIFYQFSCLMFATLCDSAKMCVSLNYVLWTSKKVHQITLNEGLTLKNV